MFTILQSVVNLVITVVLTPFIGLTGALIGTLIARAFISVPCNYVFVDKKVFPKEKSCWYELLVGCAYIAAITMMCSFLVKHIGCALTIKSHLLVFLLDTIITTLVVAASGFMLYYVTDKNFRNAVKKYIKKIVHK